jgi:hypothetical protein
VRFSAVLRGRWAQREREQGREAGEMDRDLHQAQRPGSQHSRLQGEAWRQSYDFELQPQRCKNLQRN